MWLRSSENAWVWLRSSENGLKWAIVSRNEFNWHTLWRPTHRWPRDRHHIQHFAVLMASNCVPKVFFSCFPSIYWTLNIVWLTLHNIIWRHIIHINIQLQSILTNTIINQIFSQHFCVAFVANRTQVSLFGIDFQLNVNQIFDFTYKLTLKLHTCLQIKLKLLWRASRLLILAHIDALQHNLSTIISDKINWKLSQITYI